LRVYLDASVLIAAFTEDALTSRAEALLPGVSDAAIVTDFAAVEFASGIARKVRTREIARPAAETALEAFDQWVFSACRRELIMAEDVATATSLIRRLDLALRAPDAIHLAATRRLADKIATLDRQLAGCATRLRITLAA
jgi:predicted nucleic acid-binding protein